LLLEAVMQLVVFPPMPRSAKAENQIMRLITEGIASGARLALVVEAYRGASLPGTSWQLTYRGPAGVMHRQVVALEDEGHFYVIRLDACISSQARAAARMNELCALRAVNASRKASA
jgi:hypothetical protein